MDSIKKIELANCLKIKTINQQNEQKHNKYIKFKMVSAPGEVEYSSTPGRSRTFIVLLNKLLLVDMFCPRWHLQVLLYLSLAVCCQLVCFGFAGLAKVGYSPWNGPWSHQMNFSCVAFCWLVRGLGPKYDLLTLSYALHQGWVCFFLRCSQGERDIWATENFWIRFRL